MSTLTATNPYNFVHDNVDQFARHENLIETIAASRDADDPKVAKFLTQAWHMNVGMQNKSGPHGYGKVSAGKVSKYAKVLDKLEAAFSAAQADPVARERRKMLAQRETVNKMEVRKAAMERENEIARRSSDFANANLAAAEKQARASQNAANHSTQGLVNFNRSLLDAKNASYDTEANLADLRGF